MSALIDLTGQRFGHLTVISKAPSRRSPSGGIHAFWHCMCDCANEIDVSAGSLKSGRTKSCGCARSEFLLARHINQKHGESHIGEDGKCSRLYRVWVGMRERCNNPHHNRYRHYGGRGISVCAKWDDYSSFHNWAFSNGYDPNAPRGKCTIDRINVDGPYSPDNCRWVDMKAQRMNTRRCVS